jgi:hypothetical protein
VCRKWYGLVAKRVPVCLGQEAGIKENSLRMIHGPGTVLVCKAGPLPRMHVP